MRESERKMQMEELNFVLFVFLALLSEDEVHVAFRAETADRTQTSKAQLQPISRAFAKVGAGS